MNSVFIMHYKYIYNALLSIIAVIHSTLYFKVTAK